MMIHKDDVRRTLRAWDPNTTDEEIESLYETIEIAWQDEANRLEYQAARAFKDKTGHPLDSMSRWQVINQSQQLARDLVYGEYLEPINQQIALRNAEQDS